MRHIFIINPAAGKDREKQWLIKAINAAEKKFSVKIEKYFTRGEGDALRFAREVSTSGEKLRLYACGGDGTLNEVINGVGVRDNVAVGCVPCGTGNDFVKNFNDKSVFLDIEKQICADEVKIDMIESNGKYSVNICNLGFDADVAGSMQAFKRLPLVNGSMAYSLAVVKCMLGKLGFHAELVFDGVKEIKRDIMLMAVGNGICYGGGYYGTPKAKLDDGFLDVCLVNKISKLKIIDLIKTYKVGKHVDNPDFKGIIEYFKCKKIKVKAEKPFNLSNDGEISVTDSAEINILKGGLRFCNPLKTIKERVEENEGVVCQR